MEYLAHTENIKGITHLLKEHLPAVGERAAQMAVDLRIVDPARLAGILHDLDADFLDTE